MLALYEDILRDERYSYDNDYEYAHSWYTADRAAQQRNNYAIGIALNSKREMNYESINSANKTGWYTGDGAQYLYTDYDDAQFDGPNFLLHNINVAYRFPGTTEDERERAIRSINGSYRYKPKNAYSGSVTLYGKLLSAAMDFRSNCRNVTIQETNLINCKGDAIVTEMGYSMNVNSEDIEFGTLNIQGGGKSDKYVVKAKLVDGLKIGTVNLTDGATYQYLIGLYANANNIRVDTINAAEAGVSAVVKALQTIPTTNHISIGSYSCGQAALTSGSVTVKVGEDNA